VLGLKVWHLSGAGALAKEELSIAIIRARTKSVVGSQCNDVYFPVVSEKDVHYFILGTHNDLLFSPPLRHFRILNK
jgi:hypothetical protein